MTHAAQPWTPPRPPACQLPGSSVLTTQTPEIRHGPLVADMTRPEDPGQGLTQQAGRPVSGPGRRILSERGQAGEHPHTIMPAWLQHDRTSGASARQSPGGIRRADQHSRIRAAI